MQLHQTPNMKRFGLLSHLVLVFYFVFIQLPYDVCVSVIACSYTEQLVQYQHKKDLIFLVTLFFGYLFCFHSTFLGCLLERYLMQLRRAHDINRPTKKFDLFSHFLCQFFFLFHSTSLRRSHQRYMQLLLFWYK